MRRDELYIIHGKQYIDMTERLLQEADLAGMIGDREKRIGIKPNLVSASPASEGGTTHPEVVEGLIRYLQRHGFYNLAIMEGSWVGGRTEEGSEARAGRKTAGRRAFASARDGGQSGKISGKACERAG